MAVAPVVKEARAEALWDLNDIDHTSQNSQGVHDDEETHGVRAAHTTAVQPKQEEANAKQDLPNEGPEPQDVGARCSGAVDPISWQQNVHQQGGLLQVGVAQEGDVDDGKST